MMGRSVEGMEGLAKEKVTKTTGGLIALPAGPSLHKNATLSVALMRKRAASAHSVPRLFGSMSTQADRAPF